MTAVTSKTTCGEALIALLEQRGVELVFGIPGVHTLEPYRGLAHSSIRHVTPRHEQGAVFAADGYARVSRKHRVCLLITGPGVTNAATAIASAYHDSQPLLIISSATATADAGRGRGPLHDLPDQQAFMASITARSETVGSAQELPGAIERAFAALDAPRPRPVHIGIPIDVLDQPWPELSEVDFYYQPELPRFSGPLIRVDADPSQLESGRPATLGLAGDAGAVLYALADRLERRGHGQASGDRRRAAAAQAAKLRSELEWWPGLSAGGLRMRPGCTIGEVADVRAVSR